MRTERANHLNEAAAGQPVLRLHDGYEGTNEHLRADVKDVQYALGVTEDGFFGPMTKQAVKAFQRKEGLIGDGVVGPMTWAVLLIDAQPDELKHWYPYRGDYEDLDYQLDWAETHRETVEKLVLESGYDAPLIAGHVSRESGWGYFLDPQGPTGTGDNGNGHGLWQIDHRYHREFVKTGKWKEPLACGRYGCNLLNKNERLFESYDFTQRTRLRAALVTYNAGADAVPDALRAGKGIDHETTGRDYSHDVLRRAGFFQSHGW